jgi:hypothetical protein
LVGNDLVDLGDAVRADALVRERLDDFLSEGVDKNVINARSTRNAGRRGCCVERRRRAMTGAPT